MLIEIRQHHLHSLWTIQKSRNNIFIYFWRSFKNLPFWSFDYELIWMSLKNTQKSTYIIALTIICHLLDFDYRKNVWQKQKKIVFPPTNYELSWLNQKNNHDNYQHSIHAPPERQLNSYARTFRSYNFNFLRFTNNILICSFCLCSYVSFKTRKTLLTFAL